MKQGRKRPLDTPKRMIERRERVKGRGIEHSLHGVRSRRKSWENLPSGEIKRKERLITKIMTR